MFPQCPDVMAEASCRRYEALEEVVLSDQVPEVSAQLSVAQYVPIFPRTSRDAIDVGYHGMKVKVDEASFGSRYRYIM